MDGVKNKLVVYTALFGDYDNLIDPPQKYNECDFICFTDQKHMTSDIWEIRLIENCDLPPNMMNRKYKVLPHLFLSEYEWSLYVDANIAILGNPLDLAKKYLSQYDMAVPKHFARECVYDEAKECVILGKTKYDETQKQMDKYKNEGFPKNFGLGENNILFRKHNSEKIMKLMNDWWHELNIHTKRDQLSLAYVLWKNGEKFYFMDESARGSNYFRLKLHSCDISKKKYLRRIIDLKNEHIMNNPNGLLSTIIKMLKRHLHI
ncbi:glycosyltransferase domain-containing protein [Treponema sp. J25]|uniref:glycosyltransferase domain-containing protein n=1 Tax=Treponema sp. J25 TaxID=2094121 RepID=UPI0010D39949|nr:glycosyltransferase domain-containing protein [Treponema sp. J25]TCW60163.1 glycosyl transferase [Treponema sp. J25]